MRCADGERGDSRAREPDWVVMSIGPETGAVAEGEGEGEGRRVIVEG